MQVDSAKPPKQDPVAIAARLLRHYDRHARTLPWRSPPGSPPPSPYRVWLSEIMLQQTTVAAVIPYYEKFTRRWPTLDHLAQADEGELMAAWAGLGYYSRARNLIACAQKVMSEHDGTFPDNAAALTALPGIGPYTAGAIAAIAFGEQAAVVDANVERVVSRLYAVETPLPAAKPIIKTHVEAMTPADRPGDFAQAMMDLGASLCSVKNPECLLCPLAEDCAARAAGNQESFPVKPPKKTKPERTGTAYWIERDDKVWIITRPAKGMLGGMAALPDDGWRARADGDGTPPFAAEWSQVPGEVRHGFTHFTLCLSVMRVQLSSREDPPGDGRWHRIDRIDEAGLPTLFAKAARLTLAADKAKA